MHSSRSYPFIRSVKQVLLTATMAVFFFACKSIEEPNFVKMEEIKLATMATNPVFQTALIYHNPNNFSIEMKDLNCRIWIEGMELGQAQTDTIVKVPAKSDFRVPVKVRMLGSTLLKSPTLLFKDSLSLRAEGTAKLGKQGVFINYPIKYEGKHAFGK